MYAANNPICIDFKTGSNGELLLFDGELLLYIARRYAKILSTNHKNSCGKN